MTQPSTLATSYQQIQNRRLKTALDAQVQRVVVTAVGTTTVTVNTYDGLLLGTFARIKGTRPIVGEEGYVLNVTGDPRHAAWLYIGSVGGFAAVDVYANSWTSATEPSTTNSSTPVAALSNNWALPPGTYTLVMTGFAGMRNNVDGGYQGYLGIQVDGTIINSSTIGITTSAGVQPIVRAPVSVSATVGGKSGTVNISLVFRNGSGSGVTVWCYCPTVSVIAQRTS